jgi:hypothetical protein
MHTNGHGMLPHPNDEAITLSGDDLRHIMGSLYEAQQSAQWEVHAAKREGNAFAEAHWENNRRAFALAAMIVNHAGQETFEEEERKRRAALGPLLSAIAPNLGADGS